MKRTITLMLAACCLLLTACDNSSNGIIGGSDGPAQVYTNKSNENKNYKQYLTEHYVDESKLLTLDINLEKQSTSNGGVSMHYEILMREADYGEVDHNYVRLFWEDESCYRR